MPAASGLVIVDKPSGQTSHDVVAQIRRLAGTRRVGHAGTLDPMATGVLVIGVEKATRLLGTREVILFHHTDCGMLTFTDDDFKASIQADTGIKPPWATECFSDLDTDVRQSIARIKTSPFVPHTDAVRGFVFDVATGKLNEVS